MELQEYNSSSELRLFWEKLLKIKIFMKERLSVTKNKDLNKVYHALDEIFKTTEEEKK